MMLPDALLRPPGRHLFMPHGLVESRRWLLIRPLRFADAWPGGATARLQYASAATGDAADAHAVSMPVGDMPIKMFD